MGKLILLSLFVTVGVAAYLHQGQESCEDRGGHHEYLEPLTADGEPTQVCVPGDYVKPASEYMSP